MAQKTTRITTPTATKTISFENLRIRRQQQASKMYKQPLPFSVCDNTESSAIGLLLWALGKEHDRSSSAKLYRTPYMPYIEFNT